MIASATPDDYGRTIRLVAADPRVDSLIVLYIPPLEDDAPQIGREIVEAIGSLGGRVPVLTCFMSARGLPDALSTPGMRIPSYAFPEQAAIALAHATAHSEWRRRPVGTVSRFPGIREDEAAAVLAAALERGDGWLEPHEIARLFSCYGITFATMFRADTPEAAAEAAASLRGPVVLKALGPVHKTEVGAVRLNVPVTEVAPEAVEMGRRIAEHGEQLAGFIVQELVPDGVEMLVGMTADPEFGPIVACGAGGVTVELIRDVSVCIAPVSDLEAGEMVRSLTTFPLLDGFRGASRKDVAALEDVVLRVSTLAVDQPAVVEMDCNPVIVLERGAVVVDARVRVRSPAPHPPFAGRADT
jgi:acyl-CoA synthetase (NDP forming)